MVLLNSHAKLGGVIRSTPKEFCRSHDFRKLANAERSVLWNPLSTVYIVARISGSVSETRLASALRFVLQMHPLIGSRIHIDENYDAWFRPLENAVVPLRSVQRQSPDQWAEEVRTEAGKPFDIGSGPLVRVALVRSDDVSELVISCHHSICDGTSLANLVGDILAAYRDNKCPSATPVEPVAISDIIRSSRRFSITAALRKFFIGRLNTRWRARPHLFDQVDYEIIHEELWKKYRYGISITDISGDDTGLLLGKCREHNVTVGSAITVAILAAYQDVTGVSWTRPRPVTIPMDLRRHVPGMDRRVFCLLAWAFLFPFRYRQEQGFWKNVHEFDRRVRAGLITAASGPLGDIDHLDPTLIDAAMSFGVFADLVPDAFGRTMHLSEFAADSKGVGIVLAKLAGRAASCIAPSNLGRLSIPESYGDLWLDRMYFLPAVSRDYPLIIGSVTTGGRLTISLTYLEERDHAGSRSRDMDRVCDHALDYLGLKKPVSCP
jgi:NRPS condensation-like uncharacterized protein